MSKKSTTEEFIVRARSVHEDQYDYSSVVYVDANSKILLICNEHGIFYQSPAKHLIGRGCPKCGRKNANNKLARSLTYFIEQANILHESKFDYSKVNYINDRVKIEIICPNHGSFLQSPNSHLQGRGCLDCGNNSISKPEILWLNLLGIPECNRSKVFILNGKKFWVDALDQETNTIYEFYGDFWHGNPKKFNPQDINPRNKTAYGFLYENTIKRELLLKESGYNLITIWESDFDGT